MDAINLVDYYLIRHGEYDVEAFFDPSGGPYGRVGGIGIAAYIVGILVEIRQRTRRPAAAPEPVRN